jgi:hypothetical protein
MCGERLLASASMHRQRSKLVERTTNVTTKLGHGSGLVRQAEAIRFRGIITTYKLHDRALANRSARRRLAQHPPPLDEVQQRVLEDLGRDDYAILPFSDLVGPEIVAAVEGEGRAFVADAESADTRDETKNYLIRRYPRGTQLSVDAPWLAACLSDRMLGLASAYLGMWSKLEYVDFWYSVPVAAAADRVQSQQWHRDFDDSYLLKAFLYLVDVDAGTGPFEFVAGSARGGKVAELYPWYPMSPAYPTQEEFDRAVPDDDVKTFTAPSGTIVLCNTSGFHRGGFATTKPRVLATATYCSPASLKSLTERNYRLSRDEARGLSAPQRYAVG